MSQSLVDGPRRNRDHANTRSQTRRSRPADAFFAPQLEFDRCEPFCFVRTIGKKIRQQLHCSLVVMILFVKFSTENERIGKRIGDCEYK